MPVNMRIIPQGVLWILLFISVTIADFNGRHNSRNKWKIIK
jgi:hypothetical protein